VTRVEEVTAALVAARRSGRPFVAEGVTAPGSLDEAYAVQDAVAAAMFPGARPTAWKVGAPSADVEPTATPLYAVLRSPARWTTPPIVELTIEAEVGFRLACDVAPAEAESVPLEDAFDQVHATIEVCDARLSNYRAAPPLWKLADSQVNAGLVIGTGRPSAEVGDYRSIRCEVRIDDKLAFDGTGTHVLGDPRVLLRWWLQHAARRSTLRAGDVVTTGTWCGMLNAPAGATLIARMHGIGEARVDFDP